MIPPRGAPQGRRRTTARRAAGQTHDERSDTMEDMTPTRFFEQTIAQLASVSDTDGLLGARRSRQAARSRPLHCMCIDDEDEAFYVLEGDYSVFVGDDVIHASPGTLGLGPRTSRTATRSTQSVAATSASSRPEASKRPPRRSQQFAKPCGDPRNEMTRITAIAARYGASQFLGPPPPPATSAQVARGRRADSNPP